MINKHSLNNFAYRHTHTHTRDLFSSLFCINNLNTSHACIDCSRRRLNKLLYTLMQHDENVLLLVLFALFTVCICDESFNMKTMQKKHKNAFSRGIFQLYTLETFQWLFVEQICTHNSLSLTSLR